MTRPATDLPRPYIPDVSAGTVAMSGLPRRSFLTGSAALATTSMLDRARAGAAEQPAGPSTPLTFPFVVPRLPYSFDSNEPSVDAETMELHHDKHHAAYVAALNKAIEPHADLHGVPLRDLLIGVSTLPDTVRTAVRNNGGGHANHTMFWQVMGGKGGAPSGDLAAAVVRDLGGFEQLKSDLNKAAMGVFGSGWAMVATDSNGKLSLVTCPDQNSPLMDGLDAVFGNDVWEHSYYLKYRNRRADYLAAWWSVLDWQRIGDRYAAARAGALAA